MKKTDIKTDGTTEYAVTSMDYGRQGQAAGDRGLVRAVVLGIAPPLYGKPGKATVRYLDQAVGWNGKPDPNRPAGRVGDLSTRNIVAPWDEHVVAKEARKKREAQAKAEHERAEAALKTKVERLREALPESLQPRWLNGHYLTNSGHVSVNQLLAIIEHAKESSK